MRNVREFLLVITVLLCATSMTASQVPCDDCSLMLTLTPNTAGGLFVVQTTQGNQVAGTCEFKSATFSCEKKDPCKFTFSAIALLTFPGATANGSNICLSYGGGGDSICVDNPPLAPNAYGMFVTGGELSCGRQALMQLIVFVAGVGPITVANAFMTCDPCL